jgi:hypothetical protein
MLANPPGDKSEIRISTARSNSASPPKAIAGREIIGRWRYVSGGAHWDKTLYREGGEIKEETAFDGGERIVTTVVESSHLMGRKYMKPANRHGEFVVIHRDGTLGLYDPDGQWGTASRLNE